MREGETLLVFLFIQLFTGLGCNVPQIILPRLKEQINRTEGSEHICIPAPNTQKKEMKVNEQPNVGTIKDHC